MSTPETLSDEQIANMSDDEFMNIDIHPEPPAETAEELPETEEPETETTAETAVEEEVEEDDTEEDDEEEEAPVETEGEEEEEPAPEEEPETEEDAAEKEDDPEEGSIDYKAEYEKMMAPFKANGKMLQLQNPQELISLAQKGADYTRKMQALQPHLKVVRMLENHGILDEDKLSYLIDLDRREPSAIQKLVKDSGIDPMDIDTSAEPTYQPKDRRVSDAEWQFTSTLEEVISNPSGAEVTASIQKNWDQESKNALFKEPNILRVLTSQKESGVYDQISNEIERRRLLGQMSPNSSFLNAYYQVGQEMTQQGKFAQTPGQATDGNTGNAGSDTSSQAVVTTRPAKRKTVVNSDKVRAASSPKSKPTSKKTGVPDFNPLSLSDEEFEKQSAMGFKI